MGTKKYKPTTPSLRTTINITRDELTEKSQINNLQRVKKETLEDLGVLLVCVEEVEDIRENIDL